MRVPLLGGTYVARALISNAQTAINIYPEINPNYSQAPVNVTHYLTPGLIAVAGLLLNGTVRCLYRSSKGLLYAVVDNTVYYINAAYQVQTIGTLSTGGSYPVSMQDNGIIVLIVDGSSNGYVIDMDSFRFGAVISEAFYGANRVDYLDTFFILNRPNTNQFYISQSEINFQLATEYSGAILDGTITNAGTGYTNGVYNNIPLTGGSGTDAVVSITVVGNVVVQISFTPPGDNHGKNYLVGDVLSCSSGLIGGTGTGFQYTVNDVNIGAFDPLDIAAKITYPDPISTLIVMHGEIWLIGQLTTEIWYNTGNALFPFERIPGVNIIEHGCIATYSIAKQDYMVYWLSSDEQGHAIVLRGHSYNAERISTHALENEFSTYSDVSDAIGFTYQQEGHTFYVLIFPSANTTYVFDEITKLWHRRAWTDNNGNLNRIRANCYANAYQKDLVGDWQNGNIYVLDIDTYTDNGQPISRIRSFPHLITEDNRITYTNLTVDLQVGANNGMIDHSTSENPPVISLRWSNDRGVTYGNRVEQSMGAVGQYLTSVKYSRLGMARDRVYELSWSAPAPVALQGVWVNTIDALT